MSTTRAVAIVVGLGALVLLAMRGVRPELIAAMGLVYAALAARTMRSLRRIEPDATESALRRRAVRGLALALPFAIAALIAAFRDTAGESAESGFYRIFFVIVPCSLIAGWFASGAIAPGIAWLRTRRSGERTPN